MSHPNLRGFTLIELIFVMSIIGILLVVGFLNTARFIAASTKDQLMEEIISVLREAQKKTLAREAGFSYGVHLEEGAFTLFHAPVYDTNDPDNERHAVPSGFRLTSISLESGGADVIFLLFNGTTNTHGSFAIEHEDNEVPISTIRIYETGIVEIES